MNVAEATEEPDNEVLLAYSPRFRFRGTEHARTVSRTQYGSDVFGSDKAWSPIYTSTSHLLALARLGLNIKCARLGKTWIEYQKPVLALARLGLLSMGGERGSVQTTKQ